MAENPFADLIPNGGSSGGDASPAPTPFTSYSIPAAVGGADESYDPYTAQGLGVNNIQLTPGVVAVNPSVNPLGTVFLNKDTGEAYIAADRHGNRNPNVVDIYKDPSDYRAESGQANLIPIDQIPLNQIPKSPAELKRLLSNYGKVPKSSAEDQQEQNPFSDLIPGSNQTIPTQANQSVATENPFSDLIPKQSSYGSQMIGGQGSIGPSAVTSSSMPWYSALGRSAAAQTAAGAIQTAGGFERAGAAPVTDISGVNAPFQRGATTQEATSAFDKAIADRQASLDAIQGIVKKQGFSTAEYGNQINDLQREIGDLQAQKEQTLKLPQYASDTQQQELIQQRQQLGQQAGALSQQATGMFPALGVSQKDTSTAAQIGRGIGGVIDLAPGMLTGPLAFPTMATMAASQAYGEAYDTKVAELKQQGVTDPAQLDAAGHEAASKEAQKSAASILPYAVFGPIAGEATSALFKGASPLTQGLIGGAAATGVNLGVSGGLRAAQGQSFLPNVEQAVPDILFGAFHGLGTGFQARAESKKAADAQLGGITPEVAPSSNPLVNEKEAQITANADSMHEVPVPVVETPTPADEAPATTDNTQRLIDLATQQLEHKEGSAKYIEIQQQIDELKKPAEAPVAEEKPKDLLANSIVHTVRNNEDIPNIINNGLRIGSNITINPSEPNQSFGGQTVTLVFDKPNVSFESKGYNPNDGIVTERNPAKPKAALIDSEAINLLTSESLNPEKINNELTNLYNQLDQERKASASDPNVKKNTYGRTAKESELERKIDEKNNQLQEVNDYIDQNPGAEEKPGVSRNEAITELTKHIPKDIPIYSYDLSEKETPTNLKLEQPTEKTYESVQKQGAREVGVRNAPAVGEGVGRQNEAEVPAKEGEEKPKKEEVVAPEFVDQANTVEEVDAWLKKQKERNAFNYRNDPEQKGKRDKGDAMVAAAIKRRITGELTAKEQAAKEKREASNYKGKPVSVDGRNGTIIGNPFGRVKVRFGDGSESTHLPEKIEAPVETGPEAAATTQVQAKEEPPKEEKITPEPTPDQMAKHDLAYVDPESLKLSEDVPNFKEGADPITGVVAGEELKGKYDPEAAGIVHIWERLNGDREVISGRHRWQLALANKVPEILIKIHREADGFTKEDALVKDAQLNIKDEKGSVKDFAAYFRNDPITKEDAQQGGLLSRSKQKNGFSIGRYSEDDLYGLFRTGKISEAKAAAIAESAPNDPALQRAAIGASKGLSAEELPGYIALLKEKTGGNEEQTNLFGEDESFIKEAMRISKAASARANELSEQIRAVQGAARNPEAAAKLGVDVKDPQGLQKRISELKEQRDKYAKFWLHDDIKEELGIKKPALPTIETTGEGNLFGEKEMPFGLIGETESTPPETEPRREDTLTGSFDFGESSEQKKSNLEDWADNTIKESKKRLNTGLDPELLFAYAVKGAFKIARGVKDFTAWSKEMLSEFGEAIRPHLEDLWSRANQLHNEEQATKYGPKPPSERETYAKGLAAHLTKVLGREPTQEELSKQVEKKFGKEEAPTPAPVAGGEGEKISIRTKDQEDQQRRGILTSVVPAGEGTSIAGITEIGNANLRSGADPFDALAKARQGDFNSLATAKAYVQGLAKKVSEALKKYGPNSPEYKDLAKQYQDYYEGLREAGTVASDILRTFQGETDLSDAADIAREYTKITGEEPSLSQHDQIRKVADKVNKTVEESNQAQQQHRDTMDAGLADVEVKTPESIDESRQQVADLSDASGTKQKAEIDRLNQENEKIKRDLEEVKQAQGQTAEELKAYYEAKIKDLENQQTPKFEKVVLDQAQRIVDKWKADRLEAEKLLKKQLAQLGSFPDVSIVATVARIMRGHISELGLDFARSSKMILDQFGPKAERFLKEAWDKAEKLVKGEPGGEEAVKAVRIARTPKPKAKTVEKIGEEKVADNLRKRIAQYQKKIDDINSGKISTPKDVEKITNEEIKGLEADLANKKQELSNARLKAKQADLFPKGKVGEKLNPEQVKTLWETAKRFYLDKGESDYDKMINDMASDIGLLPDQIRQAFSSPKGAKKASDEMYLKQRNRQMALDDAKRWLDNQKASWIGKTFGALAEKTFKLAIFGHGTAFIGTHAPTTIYTHPRAAFKAWLKGFSYSFTGKNGQIKNIVENKDLIYRPNWITARRAGLENDPREVRREGATKERGDSVMANALNAISGGRGFDALFHLRQDMFDQAWNKLSITQKTPEMAEMLANSINNATGFTKGGKRTAGILQSPITKVLFFAPKLIASRFKWLIQDPARMLGTFTKMVNPFTKVTPEERMSAIYEAKNKAKFLAYLGGTLLANQALLSVTGSNQSINFTNPKKNDWLAYKGFGYQFSTVGAFTRIARLVAQEYHAIFGDLNRFEKAEGGREQAMKNALYGYFRSGFSPIVRDMVVGATGKDYVGNVVPWSKEQPDRGRRRLTWGEVIQEQFAPIPISEASTQREIIPAVAKAASAAFSGGRLETPADIADYEKSLKPKQRSSSSGGFGSSGFGSKGFGAGGF